MKKHLYLPIFRLALAGLVLFNFACSSTDTKESNSAQDAFNEAEKLLEGSNFELGIQKFQEVKNKYPYSKLAVEAELRIADAYYGEERFVEAQNAYLVFKDFHPKHSRIDYVTYQLALSYFYQLPSTIDRDLSLAQKAILYFDEVMSSFANSKYSKEALAKKRETRTMLAAKEDYIANFYFIREKYESALGRFERLLKTYPGLGFDEKIYFGATVSAHKLGQNEKRDQYFVRLQSRFPNSKLTNKAKDVIGKHGNN